MSNPTEVLVLHARRDYVGDDVVAVCLGEQTAKDVAERHHAASGAYASLVWEFVGDGWTAESADRPGFAAYAFGPFDLIADARFYDSP